MISQDCSNDVDACVDMYKHDATRCISCNVYIYTYLREASALLLVLLIRAYQSLKPENGQLVLTLTLFYFFTLIS